MEGNAEDRGHLSRRERTKRRHREEIMAAATELFAIHGYDGTSMQMIAERAEISVGKLYLHFEGKEDIHRETVAYHADEITRKADEATDPSAPPLDRIRARSKAVIEYLDDHDDLVRFYVGEMEGKGIGSCRLDESEHSMKREKFEELIREAIGRGDIPDLDPGLLTAMIHGAGHAMMSVAVERGDISFGTVADYLDRIILKPLEERKPEDERREDGI